MNMLCRWEQLAQPLWGPASNGHTGAAGRHGAEFGAGQAALPCPSHSLQHPQPCLQPCSPCFWSEPSWQCLLTPFYYQHRRPTDSSDCLHQNKNQSYYSQQKKTTSWESTQAQPSLPVGMFTKLGVSSCLCHCWGYWLQDNHISSPRLFP